MLFDELLRDYVGEMGRFQVIVVLIMTVEEFLIAFHVMAPVFMAATPDHVCLPPMESATNMTFQEIRNISEAYEIDRCLVPYANKTIGSWDLDDVDTAENATLVPCTEWVYDKSVYGKTMVTEWDLVCGRSWMTKAIPSVFLAGMTAGNFLFGWLSDRYGRRRISFVSGIPNVLTGIASAFMPNYLSFVVIRFFHGVTSAGKTTISFVIAMEFIGPSKRVAVGSYYLICWALGYMTVGGVCYFIRSWRTVMWIIAVPEIIYYILLYFFVPESPRWLYTVQQKEEADKIMHRMARVNKVELPKEIDITEQPRIRVSPLDLFRTPEIRKVSFIILYIWGATGLTYYGIALNSSALYGDPYINFVILGGIEIPAYLYLIFSFKYLGHIWPFASSLVFAGLPLLLTLAVPKAIPIATTVLATTAKFFITATFSMVRVYTSEVYPTSIRSLGVCLTSLATRVTSPLAPYVFLLETFHPSIPTLVYSSVALLGGVLVMLLPETKDRPLVQTVAEGEIQIKKYRKQFCKRKTIIKPQDSREECHSLSAHPSGTPNVKVSDEKEPMNKMEAVL